MKSIIGLMLVVSMFLYANDTQKQKNAQQVSNVVVKNVTIGDVNLFQSFIGNTYLATVSNLANESAGVVEERYFGLGSRVKKGDVLLKIDSKILDSKIESLKSSIKELQIELEKSKMDLNRYEKLLKDDSVAKQKYEDILYSNKKLSQKIETLHHELNAQNIEKQKKLIKAPFDGIIVKKSVEVGEWLKVGDIFAKLSNTSAIDILVNVPLNLYETLDLSKDVSFELNGKTNFAKVFTVIPNADVKTRMVPLKIKFSSNEELIEGAEVEVKFITKSLQKSLLVPRDAVIKRFNQDVVFTVVESKAIMIPVQIVGYKDDLFAIKAEGLKDGMDIIVKGNERVFPNQMVNIKR